MTKILLALAAGTATAMFAAPFVSKQLIKIEFVKKQSEDNVKIFNAAMTGGLGALVAIFLVK